MPEPTSDVTLPKAAGVSVVPSGVDPAAEPEPGTPAREQNPSAIEEVSELLQLMCVADNNIGVFGLEHKLCQGAIQSAHAWLTRMVERKASPVSISVVGDKLVFDDLPVEMRNPQVARFFRKLTAVNATNLRFLPGVTLEEYTGFHETLKLTPEEVERMGGVAHLWEQAGVTHVIAGRSAYVMVDEDQRVVDKDARVVEGEREEDVDGSVLQHALDEALQQAKGKSWFMDKLRSDPREAARLIARGVENAAHHETDEEGGEEHAITALVESIRQVGANLIDEDTGKILNGRDDLKNSVLELEQEIRSRSARLMSTGASRKFIGEILDVVTAYSDQVKAERLAEQFLRDESSLKKTEKLLRQFASKSDPMEHLLKRLRTLVIQHGLKEEDVEALVEKATQKPARRTRKKSFDQALHDGISQRVRQVDLGDDDRRQEVTGRLTTFFENKLREKEKEHGREKRVLKQAVGRRDRVIEQVVDSAIVLLDPAGAVEYASPKAAKSWPSVLRQPFRSELVEELKLCSFPLSQEESVRVRNGNWDDGECAILLAVSSVVQDADGNPFALLVSD